MQNEVNYQRSASELEEHASMFWPVEISQEADKISVIPRLLQTQDDFIAILSVPVSDLYGLFNIVNASSLSGNLFLKHLIVLADVGGEFLQRVCGEFEATFPSRELEYVWNGRTHRYEFQMLPNSNPTNARLGVSGRSLGQSRELDE
ncbi:MAG: hypothetical protein OXL96_02260 [Candidatus Poribacteria bacterium]|nr:hypothetical protein [Candidatus Poribacteria bacterium]